MGRRRGRGAAAAVRDRGRGLLHEAVLLDEQLPATLAALGHGRIGWEHARVLAEQLGVLADDAVRAAVEARLLARIGFKTPPQLKAAARAVARSGVGVRPHVSLRVRPDV